MFMGKMPWTPAHAVKGVLVKKEKQEPASLKDHDEGEGHLFTNILKIAVLVAILVAFWFLFDKWLSNK